MKSIKRKSREIEPIGKGFEEFMSEFKTPQWNSFNYFIEDPKLFYPSFFADFFDKINENSQSFTPEVYFWYILALKYIKKQKNLNNQQLYLYFKKYEVTENSLCAFINPEVYKAKIQTSKKITISDTDFLTTYYILHIFHQLGKLSEYLATLNGNRKKYLENYILDVSLHLKMNSSLPQTEVLFYIVSTYILLGNSPVTIKDLIIPKISNSARVTKKKYQIFRLLLFRVLDIKDYLKENEILALHRYQKPNGGYNFKNSAIANIQDTFWIGYTLETYSWFLPYRAGPLYAFILLMFRNEEMRMINDINYRISPKMIIDLSRLIVLYGNIFNSLMDEVEKLIFTNISQNGLLNTDILSLEGGFAGAETEIIQLINQKYQFSLDIVDNEVLFRRYLNRLNPFKEKLAVQLRNQIRRYSQFDLSEFVKDYNKKKNRSNKIKVEIIVKLLEEMQNEYFFTGKIETKSKFIFAKNYLFIRENFIEKMIVCDRQVKWQNILDEKQRLEEITVDIYNMIHEIESSKERILNEIDSMIIVGLDPLKIENHQKFIIKKTLIDAAFFQKTIEAFRSEFIYLEPLFFLEPYINKWNTLYGGLQTAFRNIRLTLEIKLDKLKQEIEQKKLILKLEKSVNHLIHRLSEKILDFEQEFTGSFEVDDIRQSISETKNSMYEIQDYLKSYDQKIKSISLKITSIEPDLSNSRKKIIHKWVSQIEDFTQIMAFYHKAFNFWSESIEKIDKMNSSLVHKIEELGKEIHQNIMEKNHENAFNLNRNGYSAINQEIIQFSSQFEKTLDEKMKESRKLYPMFQALITEWNLVRNVLEALIHKMKASFQESIKSDQNSYQTEKFQLLIDSKITLLREKLIKFRKKYSSLIKHADNLQIINYKRESDDLKKFLDEAKSEIEKEQRKLEKLKLNIHYMDSLDKFTHFQGEFLKEVDDVISHYEDKEYIQIILHLAQEKNKNYFEIDEISKKFGLKSQETLAIITKLITKNQLNAALIGDPKKVEIHNKNWRDHLKLKQEGELRLRELQAQANMIHDYFNKSVMNQEILNNLNQLETLHEEFALLVDENSDKLEDFTQLNHMNMKNQLIYDEYMRFYHNVQKIKHQMELLLNTGDALKKFQLFLDSRYSLIEDFGNSIINAIEGEFQKTSRISESTHSQWLYNHHQEILNKVAEILEQISSFKQNLQQESNPDESCLLQIEREFERRVQNLMQNFGNQFQFYNEQLLANETRSIRTRMDKLIQEKQEKISHLQRKLDIEIRNKIRSREFSIAAKKLSKRAKFIQKWLKETEKEIKTANKQFSAKSKTYGIKHSPYLLDEWMKFKKEFEESNLNAMCLVYSRELVLNYTRFSIKSLKEPFVPLKHFVETLNIKHEQIQHYLMGLINDGDLKGKLDLEHDVYYEGNTVFDAKTIAHLEIIRKTNVKTYLRIQRFSNVFSVLGPILTGFASFLTILWYLIRLANNLVFIAIPVAIVIILFIYLWIRKGKESLTKARP